MNRRISVAAATILSLLSASIAHGGNGTRYSGITTMTFQNGVSPTSGYTGCEDTFLKEADPGRTWGNSSYIRCGGDGAGGQEYTPLLKFDISALPDSAIILRARIWVYQSSAVAGADIPSIHVYRSFYPWTEGALSDSTSSTAVATWTTRVSGSNWSTAGAQAEMANNNSASWQASGNDTSATGTVMTGSDTLNWAASIGSFDRPFDPILKRMSRGAASTNSRKGWVTFDVTHQVELWHVGANTNNGLIFQADEDAYAMTGVLWWRSSEFANVLYRPKLEVTYFDPTAGSSGAGTGRQIVGFPWDHGPR